MLKITKTDLFLCLKYIILYFIFLILHLKIKINFGDDSYYNRNLLLQNDLFDWSIYRYLNWSSRQLIELLLVLVSYYEIVWKLLNSLFLTLLVIYTSKLMNIKSYFISLLLLFLIPITCINNAGWESTTVNYVWTLTSFIIALFLLKESFNRNLKTFEIIIGSLTLLFATNLEQITFISIFISFYIIFRFWKNKFKSINLYQILFILITFGSFIYIITCIGNQIRYSDEIQRFFPNYLNLSLLEKTNIGFSTALIDFISTNNIFIPFSILLSSILIFKNKNYLALVLFIFSFLYNIQGLDMTRLGNYDVNIIFFITFFLTVSYLLFKYNKICLSLFLLGFASKVIIAFSPTIYASGNRTSLFFIYIIVLIMIMIIKDFKISIFEEKNLSLKPKFIYEIDKTFLNILIKNISSPLKSKFFLFKILKNFKHKEE